MEGDRSAQREKLKRLTSEGLEAFRQDVERTPEERLEIAEGVVKEVHDREIVLVTPEWYENPILLGTHTFSWEHERYAEDGMEEKEAVEKSYEAALVVVRGMIRFHEDGGSEKYSGWWLGRDKDGNPVFKTRKKRKSKTPTEQDA